MAAGPSTQGSASAAAASEPRLTDANAYLARGSTHASRGENDLAAADFSGAIRLKADFGDAYFARAGTYFRLSRYAQAVEDLRQVLRLQPGSATVYMQRASRYKAINQFDKAIEDFTQVMRLKPGDIEALFQRAFSYSFLHQNERALADLNEVLRLNPAYQVAYALRSTVRKNLGNVAESEADHQKLEQLNRVHASGVVGGVPGGVPGAVTAPKSSAAGTDDSGGPPWVAGKIRVPAGVIESKLVHQVTPVYPPLAKQARVQGTVQFQALIGKDGAVRELRLISGHPMLVPAAQEAVKQWVYTPTLLNGEPVEVVTQIDVNFTLSQENAQPAPSPAPNSTSH